MSAVPATSLAETIEQRVVGLLRRWREETRLTSSSSRIMGHPAYQEMISLGEAALPFLFRDLQQTQDGHLSKALSAITGSHPVPAQCRGHLVGLGPGARLAMVNEIETSFPRLRSATCRITSPPTGDYNFSASLFGLKAQQPGPLHSLNSARNEKGGPGLLQLLVRPAC